VRPSPSGPRRHAPPRWTRRLSGHCGSIKPRPKPGSRTQTKTGIADPKLIDIRLFVAAVVLPAFSRGTGVQIKTGITVPNVAGKVFRSHKESSAFSPDKCQRPKNKRSHSHDHACVYLFFNYIDQVFFLLHPMDF